MARRRLTPAERRGELLGQALLLFSTRPYDEVTAAEIATAAGASEGLVFRYFGDKRSLYLEAIRAGLERAGELGDPGDPDLPPTERFEIGLGGLLEGVERFPYVIPNLLQGGPAADPEVQALVRDALDRIGARIIERMGVPDPPARLRVAIRDWLGYVQFSTAQWVGGRDRSREELMRTQIAVFRALAADALGIDPVPTPPGGDPPLLP